MEYADAVGELARFFLDEFASDPIGTGDWVAQGDFSIDDLHAWAKRLAGPDA